MRIYRAPSIKLTDLQRKVYTKAKHLGDKHKVTLYCKRCDTQVVGLAPMIEHIQKVSACK